MYYRNAQAAVVVYDVTKAASLDKAKSWVKELQRQANPNIVIALAGNKVDLVTASAPSTPATPSSEAEDEPDDATATPGEMSNARDTGETEGVRQVPKEEAQAYASESNLLFFETSAKRGDGVVEIFTEIGLCLMFSFLIDNLPASQWLAKKIPIEHILASSRTSSGARAGGGSSSQAEGGVNLAENAPKGKDACQCWYASNMSYICD